MNADMMRALNFTDEDIAANRSGDFTERQRANLPRPDRRPMLMQMAYGTAALIATLFIFAIWTAQDQVRAAEVNMTLLVVGGIGFGLAGFFFYRGYDARPRLPGTFEVKRVTGPALLTSGVNNNGNPIYRVRIDDPEIVVMDPVFPVPEAAYRTFKQGTRYHVYYAPGAGILSVEVAGV